MRSTVTVAPTMFVGVISYVHGPDHPYARLLRTASGVPRRHCMDDRLLVDQQATGRSRSSQEGRVMTDFIILIKSNGNGDPVRNGTHGHWCVVTDNTKIVAVNQLAAGGKFPHADCGEASVKSILAPRRLRRNLHAGTCHRQ